MEVFGGSSRSTASTGGFSPIQEPWVPVYLVSWALSLGAIASVMFRLWQLPLPLLFFTPFAQPGFPRKLRLRGCRRWLLAPDSERVFAFGSSSPAWYPARPRRLLP